MGNWDSYIDDENRARLAGKSTSARPCDLCKKILIEVRNVKTANYCDSCLSLAPLIKRYSGNGNLPLGEAERKRILESRTTRFGSSSKDWK